MTKSHPTRAIRARWSPALPVVVALWLVVLFLSFYQAQAIRDEIDKSDVLREQAWLREAVNQVMRASDAVGISGLREELASIRAVVNTPYTVLEAEPAAEDGPPADVFDRGKRKPEVMSHTIGPKPRRVLVIGASSIQFAIGVELEKRLPKFYRDVKVKRYGQLATGLSRPDFMNWPDKLRSLAKTFKPDLVICNFGGNDAQPIPVGKYGKIEYGTPEWDAKYAERVTEIIDIAKEHGADTVMIGMPIMRSPAFSKKMRRLNRIMRKATEDAKMLFVPTYEKASTPDGRYRTTIEYRGKRGLMRTSDGVHYTRLGGRFMIEQIMQEVERRYEFVPKAEALAVAQRHGFESKTRSETVWYTAYVPQGLEGRRPSVVLLPDGDDWISWPRFPHRPLQRWAQKRQVILLVPEAAHKTAYVGPLSAIMRDELPRDLARNLPVSSVAYAGSGRGALSALAAGRRSPGLLLYRPWYDPSRHTDDPALLEALGDPATRTGRWGSNGWARSVGPPVWLQAGPKADALRKSLGNRLLDAGKPAKTFLAALDAGLPVLVPPPDDDDPAER